MFSTETGNVYYVDATNGRDGNSGGEGSPWKSLQYAANNAQPGDIIYVKAGVYKPFKIDVSGTEDSPIVFAAFPGDEHKAVIDGSGTSVRGVIEARGESHLTISGFRIQNAPSDGIFIEGSKEGERGIKILDNVVDTTGNAGIYVCGLIMGSTIGVDEYRMFDVLIEGNEVTNTNFPDGGNECISVGGGVDGFVIRNNWVHDSQQYGIDAKFGAINGEISGNLIHGIEKHGIYLDSNSRTIANVEIFDNVIFDNNNGIVLSRESARSPAEPNIYNIDIYNNQIYDNAKYGIMAYKHKLDTGTGLFDDVMIFSNTITGNGIHGVHLKGIGDYATNFVLAGNEMSGNGKNFLNEIGATITDDVSVIDTTGLAGLKPPAPPVPFEVSIANGSAIRVAEGDGTVTVRLELDRAVPQGETVTVTFELGSGTATAGDDYGFAGGVYSATAVFNGGFASIEIPISILQDGIDEADETFSFRLLSVGPNAQLGSVSETTITIVDDDEAALPPPPVFEDVVLYRVNAGGGRVAATDGGPDWEADTAQSNSRFLTDAGSNNRANSTVTPGETVSGDVPAALFASERWDKAGGSAMRWGFDVDDGAYEVRLYVGNGYAGTGSAGDRTFAVAVEGEVPAEFAGIDPVARFGHLKGGVLSTTVEVTDGRLDLEFLHMVENPQVNAIEIVALRKAPPPDPVVVSIANEAVTSVNEGDGTVFITLKADQPVPAGQSVTVSFAIESGTATGGADGDFSFAGGGLSGGVYTAEAVIAEGSTDIVVPIQILQDLLDEPDEAFVFRLLSVDGNAEIGARSEATIFIMDDDEPPVFEDVVLYRVNAGGGRIAATDGGPDWEADTAQNNSRFLTDAGSNNRANSTVTPGETISGDVPAALFASERWDKAGGSAMRWGFDVDDGAYEVRLYVGNGYAGTGSAGDRTFAVSVEGEVPAEFAGIDPVARFGHLKGGVLSTTVEVTDGRLDLEFLHMVENPQVNAIEIVALDQLVF